MTAGYLIRTTNGHKEATAKDLREHHTHKKGLRLSGTKCDAKHTEQPKCEYRLRYRDMSQQNTLRILQYSVRKSIDTFMVAILLDSLVHKLRNPRHTRAMEESVHGHYHCGTLPV